MEGNKIANNFEEASEVEERYEGKPHGWVQWKGTSVCMDVHCKCGCVSHVDADFAYIIQCPNCKTIYSCNGHIELIELREADENVILAEE